MKPSDTRQVIVDTTVQPKNVMSPTDAKLIHRARERLVRLARKTGLNLRQTYVRVGKLALIKHQRYAHAKQFKRAKKMRCAGSRPISAGPFATSPARSPAMRNWTRFSKWPLYQAATGIEQRQLQRGRKIYSLDAHEVEWIGKGKAHRPYEFGVKVSVATTLKRSKGGQFALHAKALPGNPYDGHTLASVIPDMEEIIGNEIGRILADAGYRGHNAPQSHKFRVFTSGQKRRVTAAIKRQMRRRSAVGGRARDRPHQDRAPHGPQLPRRPAGRRRQRHPGRRRLQLLPPAQMAEVFFVALDRFAPTPAQAGRRLERGLFTVDHFSTVDSDVFR
ncbi:hypothetical protein X770_31805 [Mesorhizobium sp. LSJC269B00]|nr:hypothetical protein X770_31805 [Mesorhizobium sp. LSJC269B00]